MGERLLVRRLALLGPGRYYGVACRPCGIGIAGPSSTGKSSILSLIAYCWGARVPPSSPEMSKCSEVYLECSAGGETFTIARSLRAITANASLYAADLE